MADHQRNVVYSGVMLALLGVLGAPGAAQTIFDACYTRGTGTVSRINVPGVVRTACARSEYSFSWTDGAGAIRVGTPAVGDLSGTFPQPTVVRLRGRLIDATAPTDGQVLRFDVASGTWKPATPTSGGGGTTDHGALTGLGDDDHPQYVLADGVRTSVGGFAVTGGYPNNFSVPPIVGEGTRMMWIGGMAAFRAGFLDASHATLWQVPNIGLYSVAFGSNSSASGQSSFSCCGGSTASGNGAVALGNSTASGEMSTAIGASTASGGFSTAIGWLSEATAMHSIAMGVSTTASGDYSVAIGRYASTDGQSGSFVYGDNSSFGTQGLVQATAPNQFVVRAAGGVQFRTHEGLLFGCNLPASSGSWDCSSSVTLKTDFEPVNGEEVLAQVRELPVQRWSYRGEDGVRHLGTFAEDFRRAFGLGTGETTIGMIDMDGVNLAAAQALERRTRDLQAHLAVQDEEIRALRAQLAEVIRRLEQLEVRRR